MDLNYHDNYLKYKKKYSKEKTNLMRSNSRLIQMGGKEYLSNDNTKLIPRLSKSNQELIVKLDNLKFCCCEYNEGPVGLTYINFGKNRAKVFMDVRGGWPAYINGLSTNEKQFIDGICIAGGSILGLEATTGITAEWLKKSKYINFPGINGAIIYSSNLSKNKIYPDKNLGRFAYNNLSNKLYSGQVGAGQSAAKGQGVSFFEFKNGIKILAIVVNNSVGKIYDEGKEIKGNYKKIDFNKLDIGKQTTITVVITNLMLDNDELKQMAHQVNCSMAESIKPFNTFFDGDIFYACSTYTKNKPKKFNNISMIKLFMEMSRVVKEAIFNSIK